MNRLRISSRVHVPGIPRLRIHILATLPLRRPGPSPLGPVLLIPSNLTAPLLLFTLSFAASVRVAGNPISPHQPAAGLPPACRGGVGQGSAQPTPHVRRCRRHHVSRGPHPRRPGHRGRLSGNQSVSIPPTPPALPHSPNPQRLPAGMCCSQITAACPLP